MAPRKIAFLQIYLYMFFVHQTRSEENLSLGKSAVQSNSHSAHYASKAVDGCFKQTIESGCCSHTAPDQNQAWWQVDLGSRATISYITIYYRDERKSQRFAGYQLYLSNITDYRNGVLCYEDTSNSLTEVELVITHQCPYTAQYVTIYNYRNNPRRHDWYSTYAYLELCEVQVYGCPRRTYGYGDCNEVCSDNCYLHNCHATNGSCFSCRAGKQGDLCDKDSTTDNEGGCNITNGSFTDTKEQQLYKENMTVIAILAVIAALCLVAAIVSFVFMLRLRSTLRKEQENDGHYQTIALGRSNPQEVYETTAPKI